ncbi:carbonic anhydrase, family 3 [Pseudonocardia sp. Ae168_Ps1]|uniref:gamma carbonic anhydrase family protein n=1 Tax=unclassified Pseudonocardia TaxID=2619320 RepID=UPI0001FFE0A0|nr:MULTISPECIES: gamma carbonic anhydrase family protein [unclassified Pseudonocardia]ALE75801.1 anhydrase [Pseudonocardia sp. EC080625-04]ALL75179.1 anhydrase [Pseudonocardia sp. EC080610-09]ALL82204.1 anhydrase [Pseudonocardia sp. EC080619-01]OLL74629.1 carbonic anhydrase, family 3 [Pseudonocardia sp. Ae150A_Ps1]OLL80609.1 carbonic anhydrase, family 3 [Pseudonocardia sp. Ae168_Ps1]
MRQNVLAIGDRAPSVAEEVWVADTATVVGSVTVGAGTGVYYGAVLRADTETVTIGAGSNVQDSATVHADPGSPARIGDGVSVGHGAVLHGCTVGDDCLVGMNATVLNGAVVGAESLVAANALVPEGMEVPPRSLVAGVPAKVRRSLRDEELEHIRRNAEVYRELTVRHRDAQLLATGADPR